MIDNLLIPLIGSVFASWVSGKVRTGLYSGIVSNFVSLVIYSAYYYTIAELVSQLGDVIIATIGCPLLVGGILGLIGGLVGVALHRGMRWANSGAYDFMGT